MTEQLLQFIWRFQYFNRNELFTAEGEPVVVISPGIINTNQGPDFSGAVLMIGGIRWAGTVELHLRTGDWLRHRHQQDPGYASVILHVVWKHDGYANELPVLELGHRVPGLLLDRYQQLMRNESIIPCNADTSHLTALGWLGWKDRLLFERLARKADLIRSFNRCNGNNWDESCWWLLARNFGNKVNADGFEMIARSLPLRVLARVRYSVARLEALLLGQAGLLEGIAGDAYMRRLQAEYALLRTRFRLQPVLPRMRFLRMRPRNFPAIRLAQLAMMLYSTDDLRSCFSGTSSLKEMKMKFTQAASPYWSDHYRPGYPSRRRPKPVGQFMVHNLVINTVVPLLYCLAAEHRDESLGERATDWLRQLGRENNSVTDSLERIGFPQENAFDSQAMIELKSQYCDQRKCLECAVGYSILNPRLPSRS